jgi:isopentenyl phosphate kinase
MLFLKLGGSLITDKSQPYTARKDVLTRLGKEIASALQEAPQLQILLGHGSGSFGHFVADRYQTQAGADTLAEWRGFAEVWRAANLLNRLVVDAMIEVELPVISLPPSASAISNSGEINHLAVEPIHRCFQAGLLPVIQGDTAFDRAQGSTILSTESLFAFLAPLLKPTRILLAGHEKGVYEDYPSQERVVPLITAETFHQFNLRPSEKVDVTGGMVDKVEQALQICAQLPDLEVHIFSGEEAGNVHDALLGASCGTVIRNQ